MEAQTSNAAEQPGRPRRFHAAGSPQCRAAFPEARQPPVDRHHRPSPCPNHEARERQDDRAVRLGPIDIVKVELASACGTAPGGGKRPCLAERFS
jgi:hypothetical protein